MRVRDKVATNVVIDFVKHGTTPTEVASNEIYLDVGGAFIPGVVDHHHDMGETFFPSTSRMIYTLLLSTQCSTLWPTSKATGERIRNFSASDETVVIKTHFNPDFDAVVSCYILKRYLSTGADLDLLNGLVEVVDRVDQGSYDKNPLINDLWYLFFWYFTNILKTDDIVCDFFNLIDLHILNADRLTPLESHPEYQPLNQYFSSVEDRYKINFSSTGLTVPFFNAEKSQYGLKEVIFLSLDEDLRRDFQAAKILFRKKSKAIWVVYDPSACDGLGRLTLSVDGSLKNGLLGYGWVLEFLEKYLRKKMKDPRYPFRKGPVRAGYRNSDPWYDGRGHAYTIVDSPNSGTILSTLILDDIMGFVPFLNNNWSRLEAVFSKDRNALTGFFSV